MTITVFVCKHPDVMLITVGLFMYHIVICYWTDVAMAKSAPYKNRPPSFILQVSALRVLSFQASSGYWKSVATYWSKFWYLIICFCMTCLDWYNSGIVCFQCIPGAQNNKPKYYIRKFIGFIGFIFSPWFYITEMPQLFRPHFNNREHIIQALSFQHL